MKTFVTRKRMLTNLIKAHTEEESKGRFEGKEWNCPAEGCNKKYETYECLKRRKRMAPK